MPSIMPHTTALMCKPSAVISLCLHPTNILPPHSGVLWGKKEHLLRFQPYGVRLAPTDKTSKWSTGMPAFEIIVGVGAAIDYIASLVPEQPSRRTQLVAAMAAIKAYESEISERFLRGVVSCAWCARLWQHGFGTY